MNRFCSTLLPLAIVLMFSSSAQNSQALAPNGVPGLVYIAAHPVNIRLDGKLEDWRGVPRVTVTTGMRNPTRSADGALTFAVAADNDFLYLLADIADGTIIAGQHGDNVWEEDSLEVYLSANRDLERSDYSRGVAQLTVPALGIGRGVEKVRFGRNAEDVGAEAIAVQTETGYRVEMRVPLNCIAWQIKPSSNLELGFDIHLNDTSSANKPQETRLTWSAKPQSITGQNASNTPSTFGRLHFK